MPSSHSNWWLGASKSYKTLYHCISYGRRKGGRGDQATPTACHFFLWGGGGLYTFPTLSVKNVIRIIRKVLKNSI